MIFILIGIVFKTPKRYRALSATIVALIIISMALFVYSYIMSYHFRDEVNMVFLRKDVHILLSVKDEHGMITAGGIVPLPPKTAFQSRFSNTGAQYITKTSEENIIKYFSNICEDETDFKTWQDGNETIITVLYQNYNYRITIKKEGNRNIMLIDAGL